MQTACPEKGGPFCVFAEGLAVDFFVFVDKKGEFVENFFYSCELDLLLQHMKL